MVEREKRYLVDFLKNICYNIYNKLRKEIKIMINDLKILRLETRIQRLEANPKNIKCPGVLRALRRELNNLKR